MSWKSSIPSTTGTQSFKQPVFHSFNVNERCFIRKAHPCGKIFGASKSCFIACPTDDELEPILDLMSEKLTKVGVEPVIAVKERAYGQDIFCTKICGKIIEARFCLVILDDAIEDGKNIPNPNVYYEYGLMTTLRKHIIPLQKEALKLAFNIQSYDTIKYSSRNIASELDRAIKDAIRISEAEEEPTESLFEDKSIFRRLELAGLQIRDHNWFLWDVISDTLFKGFGQYDKQFYAYIGKLDSKDEFQTYLEDLDVVLYRTEKKVKEVEKDIIDANLEKENLINKRDEDERKRQESNLPSLEYSFIESEIRQADEQAKEKQGFLDLMRKIYVAFIVDQAVDCSDFEKKARATTDEYDRYELTFSKKGHLVLGNITISLEYRGH